MKTNLKLARVVNVRVKEGKAGLLYATSPELKGLLVAEPTLDALDAAIPGAITALYKACGLDVVVTKMDDECDGGNDTTPWVAFPADVARAALENRSAH